MTQTAVVGKCLETGETGKRTDTQLGRPCAPDREGAGKAGGEEELAVLIIGELAAVTKAVALALLDAEVDLALIERLEESLFVDEGDLDDGLPVLLLAV
ncbi:hypothetical protein L1887_57193 [Cichorium endivia]|nr:hypothetical protein L1887_57193 [Cichorium endivia]